MESLVERVRDYVNSAVRGVVAVNNGINEQFLLKNNQRRFIIWRRKQVSTCSAYRASFCVIQKQYPIAPDVWIRSWDCCLKKKKPTEDFVYFSDF